MTSAPAFVRYSNPLTRALLRIGIPTGPNVLLTVRGRTSGRPRSVAVAVAELNGRRWVIGAYGDVQWVRNLRAAAEGDVRLHGRTVHVRARELGRDEAGVFYAETLPAFIAEAAVARSALRGTAVRVRGAGSAARPGSGRGHASSVRADRRVA